MRSVLATFLLGVAAVVDAVPSYPAKVAYDLVQRNISAHNASSIKSNATWPASLKPNNTVPLTNTTSEYQHAGLDLRLNPAFNASGDWLTKSCSDPEFAGLTLNTNGSMLWKKADADTALTQLMDAWNNRPSETQPWSFSQFAFVVFGVIKPSNFGDLNCDDPGNTLCSIPTNCDNSTGIKPAGYLIINSIVNLHTIYKMQYDGINQAYLNILGTTTLVTDNFAYQPKVDEGAFIAKEILYFLMAAVGPITGGAISSAFSIIGKMTEETADTVKDLSVAGMGLATASLNALSPPTSQSDVAGELNLMLSTAFNTLSGAVSGMLSTLTDGQGQANQTLFTNILRTGFLLNSFSSGGSSSGAITNAVTPLLYGQMIPATWALATTHLNPFILRVDKTTAKCGDPLPDALAEYFDDGVDQNAVWCDDLGNSFFLLNGNPHPPCDERFCEPPAHRPFGLLPGGNTTNLDGKSWGNLALSDIIRSSWGGFMLNNKQNGYSVPKGTTQQVANNMTLFSSAGLPMSGGVLTPGFFNFTICLDYNEAITNLVTNNFKGPICGQSPKIGNSITGMDPPGSYTPGWCRLHATQWQKNEGNENLLNEYQISVDIFDGASIPIGGSSEQPVGQGLAIPASLPYQLIVAAGANDSEPLSFWYADQYWTSDSTAHQCSVGGYDSGTRQMDCGFSCPVPADKPPVSATVAHPLPGPPTQALQGPTSYLNTYITAAPTATPKPAPAPTYSHGWCGVHVRQYQKFESDSNPTGDYELEVTLYDAKHKIVGSSGKASAPANKTVEVSGLDKPFDVTAYYVDSDGLYFGYNNDNWWSNSSRCSVGGYDSGTRDMDCGYSC